MSEGGTGPEHRRRSMPSQIAQAYRTANEVLSAALSLGVLIGGGYWLDTKFGWTPVLTIFGAVIGFVVAGASLRVLLRRLDQEAAKTKARKPDAGERQSK